MKIENEQYIKQLEEKLFDKDDKLAKLQKLQELESEEQKILKMQVQALQSELSKHKARLHRSQQPITEEEREALNEASKQLTSQRVAIEIELLEKQAHIDALSIQSQKLLTQKYQNLREDKSHREKLRTLRQEHIELGLELVDLQVLSQQEVLQLLPILVKSAEEREEEAAIEAPMLCFNREIAKIDIALFKSLERVVKRSEKQERQGLLERVQKLNFRSVNERIKKLDRWS